MEELHLLKVKRIIENAKIVLSIELELVSAENDKYEVIMRKPHTWLIINGETMPLKELSVWLDGWYSGLFFFGVYGR